ncbi:MAG: preprotein translocase subunit SecY [Oscillospiraceae bacterium]
MFSTFRNAWKIGDLRKRILYTLLILVIFRLGVAVSVPFINVDVVRSYMESMSGTILGFMDMMGGDALSNGSLFALGVQPYINASIIIQLLAVAFPSLDRMRKEGPEGQRKYNRLTRYFGGGLAVALGIGYYWILRSQGALLYGPAVGTTAAAPMGAQLFSAFVIVLAFTAGSLLLMWMGEQIDQKGVGNGISMLIFAGIISRGGSIFSSVSNYLGLAKGYPELGVAGQPSIYIWLPIIFILALAAIVLVVILNSAERRIPVQYAKKVVGRKMYGGQSSHLPIKVNMSGVMPIIFASSLTSIPATILTVFTPAEGSFWYTVLNSLSSRGYVYAIIYALLIIAFNYFYVAITYNPIELANNLKKNNGSIPGIRPGKPTSDFISKVISKVTLIGAIFLLVVAIGPIILGNISGVNIQLGGTSLLIVVGVALDTTRSLESFMLMRHHKGFLE